MKPLFVTVIFLLLSAASISYATPDMDRLAYKLLLDEVVDGHHVASDESIKALIKTRQEEGQFDLTGTEKYSFFIQYTKADGECLQEGAVVTLDLTGSNASKTKVTFFRSPRFPCQ